MDGKVPAKVKSIRYIATGENNDNEILKSIDGKLGKVIELLEKIDKNNKSYYFMQTGNPIA